MAFIWKRQVLLQITRVTEKAGPRNEVVDGANTILFRSVPSQEEIALVSGLPRCARNDNPLLGSVVDCHCEERSDEAISIVKNASP